MFLIPSSVFANEEREFKKEVNVESLHNKVIVDQLKAMDIDAVVTSDNQVKLANIDPKAVEKANEMLQAQAASYPTSWVEMPQYRVATSKHFQVATKLAFAAALEEWIFHFNPNPYLIVGKAAAAFGTYYFVFGDTETVYYFKNYWYREIGPGWFDWNGTFYGEYEILRVERTTLNSDNTGGQVDTRIEQSTIIDPWF